MTKRDETKLTEHFEFGKNWQFFLKGVNDKKINAAIFDIENFLGKNEISGKIFIDIGCGSGLSSLAAYKLGASEIYSYDIDPLNVDNVNKLKKNFSIPLDFKWHAEVMSIVDDHDLLHINSGDIVYAWGVLHHTGDMWKALKNTLTIVKKNGVVYLMIYRDAHLAYIWKIVKKTYVHAPNFIKFIMRNSFAAIQIAGILAKGKNPFRSIKNYELKSRGMSWYTDVVDWIGGYPFEYAEAEEIIDFFQRNGFELAKIKPKISKKSWGLWGTGSYQYIFRNMKNR